jgi:hypothetical protein
VANIGYSQVVRHCNHFCGFCSNPTTPYTHDFESMRVLVDDLVARGYFGVILTGGEPTLHPELPRIAAYAAGQGLHRGDGYDPAELAPVFVDADAIVQAILADEDDPSEAASAPWRTGRRPTADGSPRPRRPSLALSGQARWVTSCPWVG